MVDPTQHNHASRAATLTGGLGDMALGTADRSGGSSASVASSGAPAVPLLDRLAELEMRLRRIGAEVLAARVFDDVAAPSRDRLPGGLTRRQSEVLSRLLDGKRVRSIAGELYVNPSTVRNHLAAIFRRFGVHTQAELLDLLRARAEAAHER